MTALTTRAMLATLNISCWTAMRKDDSVAKEVDQRHNAERAGLYRKHLVPKESLEGCHTAARLLREHHNKFTLPWTDGGTRLLPTKLHREYDQKFSDLRDAYFIEVDKFIALYDSTLQTQARKQLGSLYDPKDYPPGRLLRSKFGVQLDLMPVPAEGDFRVDIGAEQLQRVQKELAARLAEREKAAVADAWKRICDVVGNVHVRLTAERPIIRDSLAGNATELAAILPGLNLGDDKLLQAASQRIATELILDLASLRKSKKERERVAKLAADILELVPYEFRITAGASTAESA